jgi:glucosamine-6-phosphate deaminase
MEVVIRPNADAATDLVARVIARELRDNPRLVMGLATGRTMESVYARLVQMHRERVSPRMAMKVKGSVLEWPSDRG